MAAAQIDGALRSSDLPSLRAMDIVVKDVVTPADELGRLRRR